MKVIDKKPIPTQTCRRCGAEIEINYKDLKYNGWEMANTDWRCPLCKTTQGVCFKRKEELKGECIDTSKCEFKKIKIEDLPEDNTIKNIIENFRKMHSLKK